jgi:tetraacyldisaccharide-1-P 4'-kinase
MQVYTQIVIDSTNDPFQAYQRNAPNLRSNTTRVVVNVQGTNSVPPAFSHHTYSAKVLENAPVGASLLRLLATDKDQVCIQKCSETNNGE